MPDWRPIVSGLVVFLVLLVATLGSESEELLLLVGFPAGLVAGYRRGGVLAGFLYGGLVGFVAGLFLFASGYSIATSGPVAPGVGITLFAIALVAGLIVAESAIAGGVGGFLSR